jgi:hypothetical protein
MIADNRHESRFSAIGTPRAVEKATGSSGRLAMRRFETCLAGLLWIAVAVLLPMAALQPVSVDAARPALALGACADGSPNLAMGCASVSL